MRTPSVCVCVCVCVCVSSPAARLFFSLLKKCTYTSVQYFDDEKGKEVLAARLVCVVRSGTCSI